MLALRLCQQAELREDECEPEPLAVGLGEVLVVAGPHALLGNVATTVCDALR
jgi:hypothetical protein